MARRFSDRLHGPVSSERKLLKVSGTQQVLCSTRLCWQLGLGGIVLAWLAKESWVHLSVRTVAYGLKLRPGDGGNCFRLIGPCDQLHAQP